MKVLLFSAEGVQDEEFFYPYYRLQEDEIEVKVVTPDGEKFKGKYGIPFKGETFHPDWIMNFSKDFNGVIIPGGWQAPEIMRQSKGMLEIVRFAHSRHFNIGAICHGPQVLISALDCSGMWLTGYQGIKDDIVNAGADYYDTPTCQWENITTSPHYKYNHLFMKQFLFNLKFDSQCTI